jgi:hypothetical protein
MFVLFRFNEKLHDRTTETAKHLELLKPSFALLFNDMGNEMNLFIAILASDNNFAINKIYSKSQSERRLESLQTLCLIRICYQYKF